MYIVLEGIDGAGKSSQAKLLNEWLSKKGFKTKIIVEPTKSDIGKLIRKELLNPESTNDTNQQMLTLLFAADRLTLKKEILDSESEGSILISDRSFYSSICYQNNSSVDSAWIYDVNTYTPRPDLTVLLDLPQEEAIKRCDKEEVFENIEFLRKTRNNYLNLLKTEKNMEIIDASNSIDEVQQEIRKKVEKKLDEL